MHPQEWEESIQYAGKRVVVIGSGATAATVVPVMAETAAHVTMLQRSPGYLVPAGVRVKVGVKVGVRVRVRLRARAMLYWQVSHHGPGTTLRPFRDPVPTLPVSTPDSWHFGAIFTSLWVLQGQRAMQQITSPRL